MSVIDKKWRKRSLNAQPITIVAGSRAVKTSQFDQRTQVINPRFANNHTLTLFVSAPAFLKAKCELAGSPPRAPQGGPLTPQLADVTNVGEQTHTRCSDEPVEQAQVKKMKPHTTHVGGCLSAAE